MGEFYNWRFSGIDLRTPVVEGPLLCDLFLEHENRYANCANGTTQNVVANSTAEVYIEYLGNHFAMFF